MEIFVFATSRWPARLWISFFLWNFYLLTFRLAFFFSCDQIHLHLMAQRFFSSSCTVISRVSRIHSFLIYFREGFGATKKKHRAESSAFLRVIFQIELDIPGRVSHASPPRTCCCFPCTFHVCAIGKSMFSFCWLRKIDDADRWVTFPLAFSLL